MAFDTVLHSAAEARAVAESKVYVDTVEEMMVAIRAVDKEHTNDQTHKVGKKMHNRNVEFYSRAFIERLCSICGDLERGSTYRLTGRVYPEQRALLFPLKTIRKVSEEGMVE